MRSPSGLSWLLLLAAAFVVPSRSAAQTFGVHRELWTGLSPTPGNTLAALTNTTYNPNWPSNPNTAYTAVLSTFETGVNTGMNYYGQRLRTFAVPPANGAYTFWISSDDSSALFLSTDEDPAHKRLVASVAAWTNSREWTKEPNQQSAPIVLEAGRRYYLEALMQQGQGGDNLAVRWQLPDGRLEEPLAAVSTAGTLLVPCRGVDTMPGFYAQPTNVTVVEGGSATFSLLVTNQSAVAYQWRLDGTNLATATQSIYTVSNVSVAVNNGQVYRCLVSNPAGAVASAPATLTVLPDTNPPVLLFAQNAGLTNVLVGYSKRVEPASATNRANYAVRPGVTVAAAFLSDPQTVTLSVSPLTLSSNYTVTVNNVRDLAARPNTIAPNAQLSFTARDFTPADIGGPTPPGSSTPQTNGLDVVAGGADIGGVADQFQFNYQARSGDFDVRVRVLALGNSDPWAKAGLMARDTLAAGSRFAAVFATPSLAGCFFESRGTLGGSADVAGSLPVNYPYTWLRLKRSGSLFTGFGSFDGNTWTPLGSVTISLGTVYLGFAVTSHNPALATTAQFRDYGAVTGGTLGAVNPPGEPLGPCTRRTQWVISEIMSKPAPRGDGLNLEYVELFNCNPWWDDISGYQLAGDIHYTFPTNTIVNGGAFLVLAAAPADLHAACGLTNVAGPYTGSLKKTGLIQLVDKAGALLLEVPYASTSPWPAGADGTGHSLVLARPSYGEADPRAWAISDVVGGSPGGPEAYRPSPLRNVVINELLAHTDDPLLDYIELYNHGNVPVDLSGCALTDDAGTNKFVFPAHTVIAARGFVVFDQNQLGFALNAAGETIFFKNPDGSRVLDAVSFEAQANGVAYGRWPDGAADFYPLAARTPGAPNGPILIGDIVINELMYQPISGNDDDQYVELYNKGASAVDLGGWQFTAGIRFTFPSNTVLAPDGYLVVARNRANLFARYPNLNAANTVGDFGGALAGKGERVALARPDQLVSTNSHGLRETNTVYIVEDEVTYRDGGRWGEWAHGGGSSLELIHPNSNHRLASNWADSDETAKSYWTNLECTGVLDNGAGYNGGPVDLVQVGLLGAGECLVDNVELRPGASGPNYVSNPTFESGLAGWTPQGDHIRSSLETSGYFSGRSLHLRASDTIWTGANCVQGTVTNTSLAAGQTATLRLKARWLKGWPEILLRVHGNWIELTGALPVPPNLGTPGQRNSCAVANAGPAIYEVQHSPPLPPANQPVVVTARFHDVNTFKPTLRYRVDTGVNRNPTYTSVVMVDDGTGGDAVAGDGLFSATIPAQPAGTVVAFLVQAQDALGATTVFPRDLQDNAGVPRECVVAFGDTIPTGSFGHYHLWLTQNWINRWVSLPPLSNENHDGTWVDGGGRIIYDVVARYAGSPYHQDYNSPVGNLCQYHCAMPADDLFLGTKSFNKLHVPGNGPGDDQTLQREQTAFWMARQLGLPWLYRRYFVMYVNGHRRGAVMEDAQVPGADVLKEHWPADNNGWLYKLQPWFEFDVNGRQFSNNSWCYLNNYLTTGSRKKLARYRWNYLVRQTPGSANDYTNVFALIDAANPPAGTPYTAGWEALADTEEYLRTFAIEHATGNWDAVGCENEQNMYAYKPTLGKFQLLIWDWNIVFGNSGSWGPDGGNLFTVNGSDPKMSAFQAYPPYRRAFLRAFQDIANGPMNNTNVNPVLDAKYAAFVANGLTPQNPAALKTWIATMRNSLLTALTNQGAAGVPFAVNGPAVLTTSNNLVALTGSAPLPVKSIAVNGVAYPLTWTTVRNWTLLVPVSAATNLLALQGCDLRGNALSNMTAAVSVNFTGPLVDPHGSVVINEIQYAPAVSGAQFVELYNLSPVFTFDLSGWQFNGLGYTFPSGAILPPGKFLVLTQDRAAFASAYGRAIPVFDQFGGNLPTDGQTLTLLVPGPTPPQNVVVDEVRYEAAPPWPALTNGTGVSLQLLDPTQDRSRVANWAAAPPTPGGPNGVAVALPPFPPLWLNEVQPENLTGPADNFGEREPWIELYNAGTNALSLAGYGLATNYAALGQWFFPTNAVIQAGQFLVVWADGQPEQSAGAALHANFRLSGGTGSVALARVVGNALQIVDYLNYAGVRPDGSYGAFPDGQPFARQELFYATPGATNSGASAPLSVFINEWMASNTSASGIADPADGNYQDWFELYNAGTNAANLAGCYLTDTPTNRFAFPIPSGYSIPPHGHLLVWADKEPNQNTTNWPDLHVNFHLPKAGASIGLFAADGAQIDFVSYPPQTSNVAMGRCPDGGPTLVFLPVPTPRQPNACPTNTPPVLASIADQTVYQNETLSLTVHATDAEAPPETLTFSLDPGAPAGATINPATGLFTWTPTAAQALTTNTVAVRVSDNGVPALSARQTFNVTVLFPPSLGVLGNAGGALSLGWPTVPGHLYRVEFKNDLRDPAWTILGSDQPGTGAPLSFDVDAAATAQSFYRVVVVQ